MFGLGKHSTTPVAVEPKKNASLALIPENTVPKMNNSSLMTPSVGGRRMKMSRKTRKVRKTRRSRK